VGVEGCIHLTLPSPNFFEIQGEKNAYSIDEEKHAKGYSSPEIDRI
jgi:hypothetical protein